MIGPENAPLRITEFTDVRCDHCAALHRTLARLRQRFDAVAFSVEPRQFPLDGECNPSMRQRSDPVRCLAAKALICMEGRESYLDYSGALFERQKTLTAAQVIALAAPHVPRSEMEACVASPDTSRKLGDDISLALEYQPEGTPLVLINGRRAVSFPPFLVAMVLTRGAADLPAFASLPPGDPNAQLY
jgi:serine/threonine-protein kinase